MSVIEAVRRGAAGVSWFVKGVLGEDAYDKYREHYEATHADGGDDGHGGMMTSAEFWRDRADRQDAHPEGRCC
jgi:uncharacterized short protein YbdD (DUF466 family)